MNGLICEWPDCGAAAMAHDNEGWVSIGFADWPEPDGRWEHERYFCCIEHAVAFAEQQERDRREIEAEVAREEA